MKKQVADQVIVITGASSGIGRATARAAGAQGAKVVVSARNGEALERAVAEIVSNGGEALAVPGDATSEVDAESLFARAAERYGRVDTVVASVMVTVYSEVEQLDVEELRRVMDVNFLSRVRTFRAALPLLKESRGTFIDVNSALAYRGIPLQAAYCASKAAARTFFESARVEQERHRTGVDVCLVLPGAFNTPQFDRARQKLGLQPRPIPPIYEPEVAAEAILRCAEHPERELPITWGAQKLLWGQKLSPRAGDVVLRRSGWKGQTTGEPKPVDSPDNLWDPLPGDPGSHGRFGATARRSSAWTAARVKLAKVGVPAVLTASIASALVGYHVRTKRGANPL